MAADTSPRILIVGAGAIGAFYGAGLQAAGADVSVVCRSEYDAVRENGFSIESKRLGDRRLMPAQFTSDEAADAARREGAKLGRSARQLATQ